MKILITGSRKSTDVSFIFEKLGLEVTQKDTIIHGGANGVDSIAEAWCKQTNTPSIIIRPIYPSQKVYYLHRNAEMIGMCDRVLAFPSEDSKGTYFTVKYAKKRGKEVKIFKL